MNFVNSLFTNRVTTITAEPFPPIHYKDHPMMKSVIIGSCRLLAHNWMSNQVIGIHWSSINCQRTIPMEMQTERFWQFIRSPFGKWLIRAPVEEIDCPSQNTLLNEPGLETKWIIITVSSVFRGPDQRSWRPVFIRFWTTSGLIFEVFTVSERRDHSVVRLNGTVNVVKVTHNIQDWLTNKFCFEDA